MLSDNQIQKAAFEMVCGEELLGALRKRPYRRVFLQVAFYFVDAHEEGRS